MLSGFGSDHHCAGIALEGEDGFAENGISDFVLRHRVAQCSRDVLQPGQSRRRAISDRLGQSDLLRVTIQLRVYGLELLERTAQLVPGGLDP